MKILQMEYFIWVEVFDIDQNEDFYLKDCR